ncbi:hypothetical protein OAN21_01955 [Alphaproteobacteria bacterium]|nr:hypothetical protein [Alphaproteobacteria bacterium]
MTCFKVLRYTYMVLMLLGAVPCSYGAVADDGNDAGEVHRPVTPVIPDRLIEWIDENHAFQESQRNPDGTTQMAPLDLLLRFTCRHDHYALEDMAYAAPLIKGNMTDDDIDRLFDLVRRVPDPLRPLIVPLLDKDMTHRALEVLVSRLHTVNPADKRIDVAASLMSIKRHMARGGVRLLRWQDFNTLVPAISGIQYAEIDLTVSRALSLLGEKQIDIATFGGVFPGIIFLPENCREFVCKKAKPFIIHNMDGADIFCLLQPIQNTSVSEVEDVLFQARDLFRWNIPGDAHDVINFLQDKPASERGDLCTLVRPLTRPDTSGRDIAALLDPVQRTPLIAREPLWVTLHELSRNITSGKDVNHLLSFIKNSTPAGEIYSVCKNTLLLLKPEMHVHSIIGVLKVVKDMTPEERDGLCRLHVERVSQSGRVRKPVNRYSDSDDAKSRKRGKRK